jgi:hypothetical protein
VGRGVIGRSAYTYQFFVRPIDTRPDAQRKDDRFQDAVRRGRYDRFIGYRGSYKARDDVFAEVKDLRPDVIASPKGLLVTLRVVLKTETDIQDFTSKLQDITRSKIQDVLGLDEQIVIRIHITKI